MKSTTLLKTPYVYAQLLTLKLKFVPTIFMLITPIFLHTFLVLPSTFQYVNKSLLMITHGRVYCKIAGYTIGEIGGLIQWKNIGLLNLESLVRAQ